MVRLIAASTPDALYQFGTLFAVLGTALVGYLVYKANARAQRAEISKTEQQKAAELVRAENEGWKSLIETLTHRYDQSQDEITTMATKLREAHEGSVSLQEQWRALQVASTQRIAQLEHELDLAHVRHQTAIRSLLADIEGYKREIGMLRREVADLQALVPTELLKRRDDPSP